jgi:hypothetical protein
LRTAKKNSSSNNNNCSSNNCSHQHGWMLFLLGLLAMTSTIDAFSVSRTTWTPTKQQHQQHRGGRSARCAIKQSRWKIWERKITTSTTGSAPPQTDTETPNHDNTNMNANTNTNTTAPITTNHTTKKETPTDGLKGAFFDIWDDYIEQERINSLPKPKPPPAIAAAPPRLPPPRLPPPRPSPPVLIANKARNETLTLADLEEILRTNGYVKRTDLAMMQQSTQSSTTSSSRSTSSTTATSKSGSVAFPQPSVLSYRDVAIGSTISGSLLGLLLSLTVYANLWLVGGIMGGLWGYDVSKNHATTTNTLSNIVLALGRRLAKAYLLMYDGVNGIWFMYKTGQLSYEYYKTFSKLDEKFAITNKMDAWNAKFQEGKRQFDKWERENEIGRRMLAGMRTAWLVEEKSLKKGRRIHGVYSKYRLVQWYYNAREWCRRLLAGMWNAVTGGGSAELKEALRGIRINISTSALDEVGTKLGAALAALITVYLVGSLFAIAPVLLGSLAVVSGLVWPTWIPEFLERVREQLDDLRAQGRGETVVRQPTKAPQKKRKKTGWFTGFQRGRPTMRPPLKDQWGIVGELFKNWGTQAKNVKRSKRRFVS